MRTGRVFVVSSPSGGGKTTIVDQLVRRVRRLRRSVSVTTRRPRKGERHGRDYWFVSPEEFKRLRRANRLLEWARVHGAYYGTPREPVEQAFESGRDVVLNIDVQGARKIRRALGEQAVLVFLLPPSIEHLKHRLMSRSTDSAAVIRRRLAAARRELACASWYHHRIVNDRLEDAVDALEDIVRRPSAPAASSTAQTSRRRRAYGASAY